VISWAEYLITAAITLGASAAIEQIMGKLQTILIGILLCLTVWVTPASAALQNHSHGDLKGQDFSNTSMVGGVFLSAEMHDANFSNSDLTGAIFTKGVLLRANLQGVDLTNALVDQATLDEADLTNAVLVGATMTRTRFFNTKVTGADFTDALIDRSQVKLLCTVAEGKNPRTGVDTKESLGC
jgi:uncharacterized protein YjbI with pentapeptide repeats